ncbi:MAG: IS110 family transposase, partial [Nocardioidaceae bacterium]
AEPIHEITGGVDTHTDTHTAAALDELGRFLGHMTFSTTAGGYADLLAWLAGFGPVVAVGVEGTGSYGAALLKLRRAGALLYQWIADGTRWHVEGRSWSSVEDALDDAAASYRRALCTTWVSTSRCGLRRKRSPPLSPRSATVGTCR